MIERRYVQRRVMLEVNAILRAEEGQDAEALAERIISGALRPLADLDRVDAGLLVYGVEAERKGDGKQ